MSTCKVKLTTSRAGPDGSDAAGDVVEVGLLEAGRLLRADAIERPDAKVLKAITAAEEGAGKEIAAANPAPDAETAAPPGADGAGTGSEGA